MNLKSNFIKVLPLNPRDLYNDKVFLNELSFICLGISLNILIGQGYS